MKNNSISLNLARILRLIKDNEPIAIHQLQDIIKLPRSTIIHHVQQLTFRGLIIEESAQRIKGKKELGSPVYLSTNKSDPLLKAALEASNAIICFFKDSPK